MIRKILIILFILLLFVSAGLFYANKVFLPAKAKSLIENAIRTRLNKEVSLESLQINIFKGLVLKNLVIRDGEKEIISIKESSCTFLIWPFFKKQIIIPSLQLKSPVIFLERRSDNTLDILDLFKEKNGAPSNISGFKIILFKAIISNGRVNFKDNYLSPAQNKTVEDLNLILRFSLPSSVRFDFQFRVPEAGPMKLRASGEYKIFDRALHSRAVIENLSPGKFLSYYQWRGLSSVKGKTDAKVTVDFQGNSLTALVEAQVRGLDLAQDKIAVNANSGVKVRIRHDFKGKATLYEGEMDISDMNINGLTFTGPINGISGKVRFDNSQASGEQLTAFIFGFPVKAKLKVSDFKSPFLDIDIASQIEAGEVGGILKDRFKVVLPFEMQGEMGLSCNIHSAIPPAGQMKFNGYLDMVDTKLASVGQKAITLDGLKGRIEFSNDRIKWQGLSFKYAGLDYKASGSLDNFLKPAIKSAISSKDLSLDLSLLIKGRKIGITQINGSYLNSRFSFFGNIDLTRTSNPLASIYGGIDLDLKDISIIKALSLPEKSSPAGRAKMEFNLTGDLSDIRSCSIKSKVNGEGLSLYKLRSGPFSFEYNQFEGIASLSGLRMALYDGVFLANSSMNFKEKGSPFWVEAELNNMSIATLMRDIAPDDKDLSGVISARARVSGAPSDLSKLAGQGFIKVTDGKLWQLNFFKGMGTVMFTNDFSSVVFREGECNFKIANKQVSTEDLKMKSDLALMSGRATLGFDGSIDASLNVQVNDQIPLTGTLKDVTTAILSTAERFGIITISGTLKDPKYKFKTAVLDILKSLKDAFGRN